MTILLVSILAFAQTSGQLIRIPFANGGITILDVTIALFCLWGLLKTKFYLHKPPSQISAALIFASIAILSLILTPLHLNSREYLTSAAYTVRFILYVLFGWLAFSGAFGAFPRNFEKAFLLSGIAFSVLGLLQFIFFPNLEALSYAGWDPHYFRTVSTFLDPNFAGAFFVLTLILFLSFRGGSLRPMWQSFSIFTIIYLALLTTFSRSSYLMFLVSGSTIALLKKSKVLFFAAIFLFLGLMLGFQIYTLKVAEPRNIDRAKSASFRFNTWQQGLYLFQKFPILGVGFNAYRYGLKEFNLGDEQFLKSHGSSSNDSSLLFVASTTGLIGLLVYVYFLFSLVRSNSQKRYIIIPAVLGLLIHSFFANSLFYPPILAWVLLISAASKK